MASPNLRRSIHLAGPFSPEPEPLAALTVTRPSHDTFEILSISRGRGLVNIFLDQVFAKALRHGLNAEWMRGRACLGTPSVDLIDVHAGLHPAADGNYTLTSVAATQVSVGERNPGLLTLTFNSEGGPTVTLYPSLERTASILHDLDILLGRSELQ